MSFVWKLCSDLTGDSACNSLDEGGHGRCGECISTELTMQGRMMELIGGISGSRSVGGGGVGVELAGVEPGWQEHAVDGCTGRAGVVQESGIKLNSGLRAWVSVSLPSAGAPTRFADDGNSRPCTRSHITSAELCKKCINKCELPAYETGYWVPLPVTAAVATAVPTWASSRISTSGSTNCVKFYPSSRCSVCYFRVCMLISV